MNIVPEQARLSRAVSSGPQRLAFLDGLRGVAALIVVIYHCLLANLGWDRAWTIIHRIGLAANGIYSVCIFFVLSGFVLSQSAAKTKSTLLVQMLSRYARLTIPMTTSLIIACFLSRNLLPSPSPACTYLNAFREGLWNAYKTGHSIINPVVWTMRMELLGSIAIYLIYRFIPLRFRIVCLIVFALCTMVDPVYSGFPCGALIREIWSRNLIRDSRWTWFTWPLAVILGFGGYKLEFYGYCLGSSLLIFSLVWTPSAQQIFASMIPRFLGRISFSLYLLHSPILVVLWPFLSRNGATVYTYFELLFIDLFLTFLAAWLMTIWLDEPLMRRLHSLQRRSFSSGTAESKSG